MDSGIFPTFAPRAPIRQEGRPDGSGKRRGGPWETDRNDSPLSERNRDKVHGARADDFPAGSCCGSGKMKARKRISLLLLAAYLFATVGVAVASLTCHCVAAKAAAVEHLCCSHCQHPDTALPADSEMHAPCCGNRHSTEVDLYTSTHLEENEQSVKCAVCDLPFFAMTGESFVSLPLLSARACGTICLSVPPLRSAVSECFGLRAPPVRG